MHAETEFVAIPGAGLAGDADCVGPVLRVARAGADLGPRDLSARIAQSVEHRVATAAAGRRGRARPPPSPERNMNIRLLLLSAAVVCLPGVALATPFSVLIDGGYAVSADGSPDTESAAVNTGQLSQISVSVGPLSGSATGLASDDDFPVFHLVPQEADAMLQATATIGALHAIVRVASSSSGAPTTVTNAHATLQLIWSDTVTFHVPSGAADFTATLVLDDVLSDTQVDGVFAGSATASMKDDICHCSLFEAVTDAIASAGDARAPVDSVSSTLHVGDGERVTFTGELDVSAFANVTASVAVDAGDTAAFFLTTNDPTASYTTASGARFDLPAPAAIPEPSSALLLLAGLAGLSLAARHGRRHAP